MRSVFRAGMWALTGDRFAQRLATGTEAGTRAALAGPAGARSRALTALSRDDVRARSLTPRVRRAKCLGDGSESRSVVRRVRWRRSRCAARSCGPLRVLSPALTVRDQPPGVGEA